MWHIHPDGHTSGGEQWLVCLVAHAHVIEYNTVEETNVDTLYRYFCLKDALQNSRCLSAHEILNRRYLDDAQNKQVNADDKPNEEDGKVS